MNQPVWRNLPSALRERIAAARPEEELYEVRIRAGRRMQLVGRSENRLCGNRMSLRDVRQAASALMEYSLYAWEDELSRGYFTTRQGFRVGVSGKYRRIDGILRLPEVYSLCIRLARAVEGCADELMPFVREGRSCLILSPPGCGKTTVLRDLARQLSFEGQAVAILDERSELAAAWQGEPTLDIGERCDCVEGVLKPEGIPMIVRALSPQVLVTDELGDRRDADAVADALRCGVRVLASAHASDFAAAMRRDSLRPLLENGFSMAAVLGSPPGTICAIYLRQDGAWKQVIGG